MAKVIIPKTRASGGLAYGFPGTGPDVSAIDISCLIGQPETEADNDTVVKGSAWNLLRATKRVFVSSCFGLGCLAIVESM